MLQTDCQLNTHFLNKPFSHADTISLKLSLPHTHFKKTLSFLKYSYFLQATVLFATFQRAPSCLNQNTVLTKHHLLNLNYTHCTVTEALFYVSTIYLQHPICREHRCLNQAPSTTDTMFSISKMIPPPTTILPNTIPTKLSCLNLELSQQCIVSTKHQTLL